ncbi:MAG: hypothetical protein A2445_01945 [Candidatus Jacksonbacteria bacterium RIFOXYC2_FULL_44_29]|nr:MAG: hypothetical protein UV19_C0005G0024 [Parcubacteria group bacterium GW2011_GWA2_42_28]KKT55152.1 MAG: hypothetical protein UW45_C0009G0024 [Parcubacteria group bacterium GW2011_GWC2_44_22]OGY75828.1 MAG: hypothetical protein A2295_00140 [Candidatus Jacksonbacteria bacterium RIFOXYB2_FULL_44_15]OGY77888.1 MAG: hypothetical protein A2445_01945 [Candidatus Jacksonbacteria bacterium RIFOXYC2_FULL_44_29]HBH46092.1 hypothetical protein [Candidatus Jacksonbacteria bacterium]
MPWPSGSDYQTAVQNPQTAFKVPKLQKCTPRMGKMGMPWVASGNFASVYCMEDPSSTTKYATRVFNRPVTVQKARYQAISDHLGGISHPFMVEFEFVEEGILVAGTWYPIVIMEWCEGPDFGKYVEINVSNPQTLLYSAAQFRAVITGLQGAHMAHGDCQHGNAKIIATGDIKLVDYDDFYVPALKGEKAIALGMPNYQHPARTADDFNEHVDNFSAILIYMSLGAIAADKTLFAKYNNGDNLILKEADFKDLNSPAWIDLAKIQDQVVKDLVDALRDACTKPIDQVPCLEDVIKQTGALARGTKPAVQPQQQQTTTTTGGTAAGTTTTGTGQQHQPTTAQPPQIALPNANVNFGPQRTGKATEQKFEIKNTGNGTLNLTSVTVTTAGSPFRVKALPSTAIGSNGAMLVTVEFQPQTKGQHSAVVEVISNDPNNRTLSVNLSGQGVEPEMIISPRAIDFSGMEVGQSFTLTVNIANNGDDTLGNINITSSDPSFVVGTTYHSSLPPRDNQDVAITFNATRPGATSAQIRVESDDAVKSPITVAATADVQPLQPVVITSIWPVTVGQGGTTEIEIHGEHLSPQTRFDFGADVQRGAIKSVTSDTMIVEVKVDADTPLGVPHTLVAQNPGTPVAKMPDAFTIAEPPLPPGMMRCPHCKRPRPRPTPANPAVLCPNCGRTP